MLYLTRYKGTRTVFSKSLPKDIPQLAHEGEVWGVFVSLSIDLYIYIYIYSGPILYAILHIALF